MIMIFPICPTDEVFLFSKPSRSAWGRCAVRLPRCSFHVRGHFGCALQPSCFLGDGHLRRHGLVQGSGVHRVPGTDLNQVEMGGRSIYHHQSELVGNANSKPSSLLSPHPLSSPSEPYRSLALRPEHCCLWFCPKT